MQESQIVGGFLFPAYQQSARAVRPRVGSFHNPATRPTATTLRNRRTFPFLGDVNSVSSTTRCIAHRFGIVTFVRTEMLFCARRRLWAPHGNVLNCFFDQLLIMHIRAGDSDPDRHTSPFRQHRALDPQLATIRRVFPGFFPHPVAPWSSPRPNSATASRFLSARRTLPEPAAITPRTPPIEPTLESTRGWRCLNRIARASLSTDNQSATHTEFQSRHCAAASVVGRLCNFFCKLGAAV
jgi:hypothetical protein